MEKKKILHSPCMNCFRMGITYPNHQLCKICEYNSCVQLLKHILYDNDNCSLCKNRINLKGGYWDCHLNKTDECGGKYYEIDWNAVEKEYGK